MSERPDDRRPRRSVTDADGPGSADFVDRILAQWSKERPDLDLDAAMMGAVMRMTHLLHRVFTPLVEDAIEPHGLKQSEFDLLATLRRRGPGQSITPSRLSDELMTSRAGMTKRIDRLEALGYLRRVPSAEDRRSFGVVLTSAGAAAIDAALTGVVAAVGGLAGRLSERECATVNDAMRVLMHHFVD